MTENETIHPDYIKGFNEGYSIAKSAPEIAETLSKATGKSERIDGFKDGRKQFIFEKEKDRLPDFLKNFRFKSFDKTEDKSKDKGIDRDKEK